MVPALAPAGRPHEATARFRPSRRRLQLHSADQATHAGDQPSRADPTVAVESTRGRYCRNAFARATRRWPTRRAGAAHRPADPFAKKVGDFYATCMDEHKAETASFAALQDELGRIDAVGDARSLARAVARLQAIGGRTLFGFGSQQDFKDARLVIGGADQGGLGLPDRDYYLKDDERMRELRALYHDHIEKMLALAGATEAEAKKQARTVMEIETALANASMEKV